MSRRTGDEDESGTTHAGAEPRLPRSLALIAAAACLGLVVALVIVLLGSSDDGAGVAAVPSAGDPGPVHVHGLGINPADESLVLATHTGMFRLGRDARRAVRINDRYQDTMGFTVVGPDRFLGSGHPDPRDERLPPLLGLIQSWDAGKTWAPVSLIREADFHVLRAAGSRLYGYDAANDRLLTSGDEGRVWERMRKPAPSPIVDLVLDPGDPERLVATSADELAGAAFASQDGGRSWTRLNDKAGLMAWPSSTRLYLADSGGGISVSSDGGRTWSRLSDIGGVPAAFLAVEEELYVALHDGTIKRSTDGGTTWTARSGSARS